jgi:hypothetical protein
MSRKPYSVKRTYIGRLPYGADLLESITKICKEENIRTGKVMAIGAVQKAMLSFYNQREKRYENMEIDHEMEIVSCIGNVSVLNGQPAVHCHITLADNNGRCIGGHLMIGTVVFACEVVIDELDGEILNRHHDEQTGLPLWHPSSILIE